jgi:hypothetical protein
LAIAVLPITPGAGLGIRPPGDIAPGVTHAIGDHAIPRETADLLRYDFLARQQTDLHHHGRA